MNESQTPGCNTCKKGQHLPPKQEICKEDYEIVAECEPDEKTVPCITEKMQKAAASFFLGWIFLLGTGITLGQAFIREKLEVPAGPEPWFWVGIAVLIIWGVIAGFTAMSTVIRTDKVLFMMFVPGHFSSRQMELLVASILWVLGYHTVATIFVGFSALMASYCFRELFKRGRQKPSATTYIIYLGFIAFSAGYLMVMFSVLLLHVGLPHEWAFLPLSLALFLSLELVSHFHALPILLGGLAWVLALDDGRFRNGMIAVTIVAWLFYVYGLWKRVLSPDPRNGRNFFVYVRYRKKVSPEQV